MYSEFSPVLLTPEDRNSLLQEMTIVSQVSFMTDQAQREAKMKEEIRSNFLDFWMKFVADHQLQERDWVQLKHDLEKLPTVELQFAIEVDRNFLEEIARLVRASTQELTLLDVKYDPSIEGGAVISFTGKISDYSVRSQVKKHLEDHIDEITTSFLSPATLA